LGPIWKLIWASDLPLSVDFPNWLSEIQIDRRKYLQSAQNQGISFDRFEFEANLEAGHREKPIYPLATWWLP
jgi:hypothetical protein